MGPPRPGIGPARHRRRSARGTEQHAVHTFLRDLFPAIYTNKLANRTRDRVGRQGGTIILFDPTEMTPVTRAKVFCRIAHDRVATFLPSSAAFASVSVRANLASGPKQHTIRYGSGPHRVLAMDD